MPLTLATACSTNYPLLALKFRFMFSLSGDRKPLPFLQTLSNEGPGRFSPDGRWIACASDESGRKEVYVAPFPGPGGKWQISNAGGSTPRWRRDGKEIFYLAPSNVLMGTGGNGKGSSFEVGAVKPLFQTNLTGLREGIRRVPDGQRFLINTAPQESASVPITVVLKWTAGLTK
jgi:eukaryotic-like serine/threonine-protein kinase